MITQAPQIADKTLLRKIQSSVLADDQKRELTTLLPQMTETERAELTKMIDDSVRDLIAADPELQKKIQALNEEYNVKLHDLVNHEAHRVREGFENLEKQTETASMRELEGEMRHVGAGPVAQSHAEGVYGSHPDPELDSGVSGSAHKHPLLKLLFILVSLGVVASAVLFGLQYFNQ